jgi:hypothetical protein
MTALDRFIRKVEVTGTGCWIWVAAAAPNNGYGRFWDGSRLRVPHEWAYEELVGPIPEGLELDHLCRVRRCVHPLHLETVTRRVNLLRGETVTARNAAVVACPQGHLYTPENTWVSRRGQRFCRRCNRERHRVPGHPIRVA